MKLVQPKTQDTAKMFGNNDANFTLLNKLRWLVQFTGVNKWLGISRM